MNGVAETDVADYTRGGRVAALGVPPRQLAPAWVALVVLAALAWVVTIDQANGMGNGPGTMGLAFPAFILLWVAMMAAMMFPSVAPVAILWARSIQARSTGATRAWRISTFVAGYLVAWAAFGMVAFVALLGTERLVDTAPEVAKWLAVGIFLAAGAYQLTPLKGACLRHCRSPMSSFLHYASMQGRARDFRIGLHHGLYCVGCCWGLMVVLVAVGVMNLAAMALIAAVIFLEKIWRRGDTLAKVVGIGFVVFALVIPSAPRLAPGLHAPKTPMTNTTPMTDSGTTGGM
jgi:predicted metal-binding membrane protein